MTDENIIAYLLEELPEEDAEQFEDACFAQKSWPSRLNLVEEDLIDAYLRNELTPERRQRFERSYLTTPAREERVILAAALLRQVDEQHAAAEPVVAVPEAEPTWADRLRAFWSQQSWALRAVASLVVISIIAGALWLSLWRTPPPETFATLALVISVNNNRADGVQAAKVKLPLGADALRISLTLPEGLPAAARYRVELDSDRGGTEALEIAGQEAQSITVVIPSGQLARGQYALKLFVVKPDGTEQRVQGSYFFNVE